MLCGRITTTTRGAKLVWLGHTGLIVGLGCSPWLGYGRSGWEDMGLREIPAVSKVTIHICGWLQPVEGLPGLVPGWMGQNSANVPFRKRISAWRSATCPSPTLVPRPSRYAGRKLPKSLTKIALHPIQTNIIADLAHEQTRLALTTDNPHGSLAVSGSLQPKNTAELAGFGSVARVPAWSLSMVSCTVAFQVGISAGYVRSISDFFYSGALPRVVEAGPGRPNTSEGPIPTGE